MKQNFVLRVNTKSLVSFQLVNISRFEHVAFCLNPSYPEEHKTNECVATGHCSLLGVRTCCCQLTSVTSYHGSAMSANIARCQKWYCRKQLKSTQRETVNHGITGNVKEWTGLSLSSLLCIADDRIWWTTIAAEASVWVASSDARASWEYWILVRLIDRMNPCWCSLL